MNRDHQKASPELMNALKSLLGDSTPPATPAEPPDENWFQRQARLAARDVQLLPPWLRSHPPAVSGEGERLKELEVLEYQIAGGGPFDREDVRLVRRRNRDGVSKWAVVNRGAALNADGEWEWEPIPSSRTDEYLARTRFATPEAALNVYRLRASTPTPGAPR